MATAQGDGISVVVDNDLLPASSATIYMVPETGGRQRLGDIPANGEQTFNFVPISRDMEFYLAAEVVGASDTRSNPFNLLGDVSRVEWSMSARNVQISR